jgi:predicted alpha/beta superfamily hydrolase
MRFVRGLPALMLGFWACTGEVVETRPDTANADTVNGADVLADIASDSQSPDSADTSAREKVAITVALTLPIETPPSSEIEVTAEGPSGLIKVRTTRTAGALSAELSLEVGVAHTLSAAILSPRAASALTSDGRLLSVSVTPSTASTVPFNIDHWGRPGASDATVVFLASVPAATPENDTVYLSGNLPALGEWGATGLETWKTTDGRRAAWVEVPLGSNLEYKFTRGTWETVEKEASGGEIQNRQLAADAAFQRVEVQVQAWNDLLPVPAGPSRIEHLYGVSSEFLGPDRDVSIYLPPGYDSTDALYPVLYMHDGQNLMDAETTAFGVEWRVDETATWLINEATVEPLIIVGIDSTEARMDEYTPVVDLEYGGGGADEYGRFLVEELKPLIESKYRVRGDAGSTGLAGSSLGGLVSMYLGAEYPDVFGRLGVISPSVWWADRHIVEYVDNLAAKLPLRIWVDIGSEEGSGETVQDTELLRDALIRKGWVLGTDLSYREYPGAEHDEASWAARFNDILAWLYPAR